MKKALLITIILLVSSTASYAGAFEDGLSHYGTGDFKSAYALWKPLAEKGDASAQYYLGQMYYQGKGLDKDIKLAYAWLSVASKNGMDLATDLLDDMRDEMSTAQIDEAVTLASGLTGR